MAGDEPISDLEQHLGFWLRFVSNHVSGRFKQRVEAAGVSLSEWVALRRLYPRHELSPTELVEALGMTKGAVSKVIARLEAKALVQRNASVEDGRAQWMVLTSAGRKLVPRLARIADENDAHFFGHLSPAERAQLMKALTGLVHAHGLREVPVD